MAMSVSQSNLDAVLKASQWSMDQLFSGTFTMIVMAIPQCLIIQKAISAMEFCCGMFLLVNSQFSTPKFQSHELHCICSR